MNRKTFCISFFLRRVRTVKGMAPILARITVNGISKEVYTQCRTPVDKWDTAKGRATGRDKLAYEVNAYIDDFRAKVVEIYRTLQAEGFEGNTLEIKERLQSPGKQAKMFLEELTLYCEKRQKEVGVRITQLTSNKYYRLCRYLREYTTQEYKKDDIRLSAVSYGYLDGFNTYLQTAHRCHHNGTVNILDCLRNFMLYCLRNEWIEKNPFKNYKLKEVAPPPKEHLSKKEIELLMEKPMPNLRLENVRDIFVFCCLTGLAFADVKELKICVRPALHRIRQTPARTEQSENERLYVRDRHDLRAEQKIDHPLRTAYICLPCGGIWDADRCAGEDSGALQYEYDAALCEILGAVDRSGDAEDRRGVRRGKLNGRNKINNRASLMPGYLFAIYYSLDSLFLRKTHAMKYCNTYRIA